MSHHALLSRRPLPVRAPLCFALFATACLSGAALATNPPPVAHAGADLTAGLKTQVTLNGTRSYDFANGISAYLWQQTQGAKVALQGADTATPRFTTPASLASASATLAFKLTVTNHNQLTASDSVVVKVAQQPTCTAPKTLDNGVCRTPRPFNDTGLTGCGDALYYVPECGLAALPGQDGEFGRDVAYNNPSDGRAGFSFVKLDAKGAALPANAAAWSCVKDRVTGLVWEAKTNDGGLRDWQKRYTHYSTAYNPKAQYGKAGDASALVNAVNQQGLCGAKDWRLPTLEELRGVVDYSIALPGPTIDPGFFPYTRGDAYWSGSADGRQAANGWAVYFNDGEIYDPDRSNRFAVRLVRGAQQNSVFTVSANGEEVRDSATGLVWKRCMEGMRWDGTTCAGQPTYYMWPEALQHTGPGRTGWRLPNVKEMASLVNTRSTGPLAMYTAAFPGLTNDQFWTSTPFVLDAFYGWVVHSFYGHSYFTYLEDMGAVRLVRDAD